MTTLGDETGAWLASPDGGLAPVIGGLFLVVVIVWALVASAHALWEGFRG